MNQKLQTSIRYFSLSFFTVSALMLNIKSAFSAEDTELRIQELKILDCAGNLRASTEIASGEKKQVKFTTSSTERYANAKLSKLNAETTLENVAKDRSLSFESVQAGEWKLCKSNGSDLAFDSVEFTEGLDESLRMASLLAGSAAVASGIAIAAEDSSTDDSPSSIVEVSNGPDRLVNETQLVNDTQSNIGNISTERPKNEIIADTRCDKPATLAAKAQNTNPCREGEEAPVLSPYN